MTESKGMVEKKKTKAYKILVADDNKGLLRLIQKRLDREGFKTEGALNGNEVIAQVAKDPPNVVLLDYSLPDMTGRQVIEALAGHGVSVPFIIMTGNGDEKIAVQMMKLGARDYLIKDASLIDLLPSVVKQTIARLDTELRLSQAEEESSRLLRRLNVQWEMAQMTGASQQTLCDFVLEEIVKMTDSRYGFYGFLNEDESVMSIHSWSKDTMKDCDIHNMPLEFLIEKSGVWGNAVRERRTLIINDMQKDYPNKKGLPEGHVEIHRVLTVPVFRNNRIIAVGAVANKANDYTDADAKDINDFMHSAQLMQDRRALEEALTASEQRFRELFMSIRDVIIVADTERTIMNANQPALRDLFGYEIKDVVGKKTRVLYADDEGFKQTGKEIYDKDQKNIGKIMELDFKKKNGATFAGELYALKLINEDGKPSGNIGIIRDITERKRADDKIKQTAEELARSNTDLERFAYIASHDLKEPLRTVSSFVTLLQQRYGDKLDKDAGEFMGFITDGTNRMGQLIDDLLTYSQVSANRNLMPVDCNKILVRSISNLTVLIEENRAKVTFDSLPTLMGDDVQLELLFQNLINNGIKFHGEEPPHIHISARQKKSEWFFSIKDNGIGIEPRNKDNIFNIFQRMHSRSEYPGTGIGLAICKKILDLHGGKIWVKSKKGTGSVFYFTLPDRRE